MRYETFEAFVADKVVRPQVEAAQPVTVTIPDSVSLASDISGQSDMFGNRWTNVNVFSPSDIAYVNTINAGGTEASAITAGQAQSSATYEAQMAADELDASVAVQSAQSVLPTPPPVDQPVADNGAYTLAPISYTPNQLIDASGQVVTTPGPEFGVPPSVNPAVVDPVTGQLYSADVPIIPTQNYALPIIGLVLAGVAIWFISTHKKR